MSSVLPPPTQTAPSHTYTCPYCRIDGPVDGTSCIHCGAPVDLRAAVSTSGWQRQPAIKDMARIQFGQSSCQVSGIYAPAAELRLANGEGVYFGHDTLLWTDTTVQLASQPLKGAWNRKKAGLDLVMLQATGPGTLALAENTPGETIVVPLMHGQAVDVREHRFVMASLNVSYEWFQSSVWYRTQEENKSETHYPAGNYLDRFTANDRPGMLMLHGHGNVFVRDLAQGQSMLIHAGSFLWKDSSVSMSVHLERPASGGWFGRWQPATPWLRLTGPGRIAVSSKYEPTEGTGRIVSTSPSTTVDWNRQQMMAQAGAVQAAFKAAKVDDDAFETALDAFALAQGFVAGKDKNRGISVAHEYQHPSGINVSCSVMDKSGVTALASTAFQGLTGVLSNNAAVGAKLGKFAAKLQAKMGGGAGGGGANPEGQPVEGLGYPAMWNADKSVLTVVKDNRTLTVSVQCPNMPSHDQSAWAQAFAKVALPTI